MPSASVIEQAIPTLRKQDFGKLSLDCIQLTHPQPQPPSPPLFFPTYCLAPDSTNLRLSYSYGSLLILRNTSGTFQGRNLALDIVIETANKKTSSAHVSTLATTSDLGPTFFTATDGLTPFSAHAIRVGAGVVAGNKIGGDQPSYPEAAKRKHASGRVVLNAVITREGRIGSLVPEFSADPILTEAAIKAVRTWTYKPYLLNGEPVEVDTTITVNFAFDP